MLRSVVLASALAMFGSVAAHSSTFSGDFGGTISAPTGHSSGTIVYEGAGTNVLSWGAPSGAEQSVEPGNASSLSVSDTPFNYDPAVAGEWLLGSITWINHSNWHTGGSWSSNITLALALNTPAGIFYPDLSVSFSLLNTTDLTGDTNHNESTGNVPDEIAGMILNGGSFATPIDLGHGLRLNRIFFQLDDAGTAGTSWDASTGFIFGDAPAGSRFDPLTGIWENREGGTSVIGVYADLSQVPLPAGVWLMISGLAGLAAVARRRSRTLAAAV